MPKPASEEKLIQWKALIEKQSQSGLPIRKWCLQNEVTLHTFHYWKAKLFPKQLQRSSFIELKTKTSQTISLRLPGLYVRLEGSCDPHLRKQLLTFIGGLAC